MFNLESFVRTIIIVTKEWNVYKHKSETIKYARSQVLLSVITVKGVSRNTYQRKDSHEIYKLDICYS